MKKLFTLLLVIVFLMTSCSPTTENAEAVSPESSVIANQETAKTPSASSDTDATRDTVNFFNYNIHTLEETLNKKLKKYSYNEVSTKESNTRTEDDETTISITIGKGSHLYISYVNPEKITSIFFVQFLDSVSEKTDKETMIYLASVFEIFFPNKSSEKTVENSKNENLYFSENDISFSSSYNKTANLYSWYFLPLSENVYIEIPTIIDSGHMAAYVDKMNEILAPKGGHLPYGTWVEEELPSTHIEFGEKLDIDLFGCEYNDSDSEVCEVSILCKDIQDEDTFTVFGWLVISSIYAMEEEISQKEATELFLQLLEKVNNAISKNETAIASYETDTFICFLKFTDPNTFTIQRKEN